jgi:hypothetical protein
MIRGTVLAIIFALIFLFSIPVAESKNQWTDQETIQFAEDLFFLVETITEDVGQISKVRLDSYKVHDGTIRIIEFWFPDDRILSIHVHRNVAGEDGAWLETISRYKSFFEPIN